MESLSQLCNAMPKTRSVYVCIHACVQSGGGGGGGEGSVKQNWKDKLMGRQRSR